MSNDNDSIRSTKILKLGMWNQCPKPYLDQAICQSSCLLEQNAFLLEAITHQKWSFCALGSV
uniref:Uncharacterized protein n=1 Tax=Arundo donax TaxID=35708 RepID=A0A0A8ZJ19_ARUDO